MGRSEGEEGRQKIVVQRTLVTDEQEDGMSEPFGERVSALEKDLQLLEQWPVTKTVRALLTALREQQRALGSAIEWGESEIHNEYDGTSMLKARLAELDPLRATLQKWRIDE